MEVEERASEEQRCYEDAVRTEELGGRLWWLWAPARNAISNTLWAWRATVKFFTPTELTLLKRNISALAEQVNAPGGFPFSGIRMSRFDCSDRSSQWTANWTRPMRC